MTGNGTYLVIAEGHCSGDPCCSFAAQFIAILDVDSAFTIVVMLVIYMHSLQTTQT